MRVVGYDPYISEAAAKEMQVELVPLEKLLAESDFISLHTAVSPATPDPTTAAVGRRTEKQSVHRRRQPHHAQMIAERGSRADRLAVDAAAPAHRVAAPADRR